MIEWVLKKVIGTKNDRELKKTLPRVARSNELEPKMRALKDEGFDINVFDRNTPLTDIVDKALQAK